MKKERKGQTRPLCKLTDAYRPNKSPLFRTSQSEHPWSSNTENRRSANMEKSYSTYASTCIFRHITFHCYSQTAVNHSRTSSYKKQKWTKQQYRTREANIYWKRKKNSRGEREKVYLTYPPARPCSASNLQCEPQLESLGFSLTPPTECHVTLTTPLSNSSSEKREEMARGKRERKQEAYLPDKAHTQSLGAGFLSLPRPELRENRLSSDLGLSSTSDLWAMNYLSELLFFQRQEFVGSQLFGEKPKLADG